MERLDRAHTRHPANGRPPHRRTNARLQATHALATVAATFLLALVAGACGNEAPPMGEAVKTRDSLPVMTTYGVSKLISDSGIIRYKIIAEEWRVFDRTQPPRQEFPKGLFLARFDEKFRTNLYITADTAFWYDQNLWEMRGNVFIKNLENETTFSTEELFWDMTRHKVYSNKYIHIVEPDQELEGNWFESDEKMNVYHVRKTKGYMPVPQEGSDSGENGDSTVAVQREAPAAYR